MNLVFLLSGILSTRTSCLTSFDMEAKSDIKQQEDYTLERKTSLLSQIEDAMNVMWLTHFSAPELVLGDVERHFFLPWVYPYGRTATAASCR